MGFRNSSKCEKNALKSKEKFAKYLKQDAVFMN